MELTLCQKILVGCWFVPPLVLLFLSIKEGIEDWRNPDRNKNCW